MFFKKTTQIIPDQSIQFSTFRKKSRQIIQTYSDYQFTFNRIQNSLAIAIALVHLLKNPPKAQFISDVFNYIQIEQIPKLFINYQHQETLQSIINVIIGKINNVQSAVDLINSFPIVQFVLNLYTRNIITKFIKEGPINCPHGLIKQLQNQFDNKELMGNQLDVLSDYNIQIRGTLLNLLTMYLGIDLKVIYGKTIQNKQNKQIFQTYGKNDLPIKLQIQFQNQDKIKVSFYNNQLNQLKNNRPKTPLINQITQSYRFPSHINQSNLRSNYSNLNKTMIDDNKYLRNQASSRSVTKDNLNNSICSFCGIKQKFCQCTGDYKRGKGVTPKNLNVNNQLSSINSVNSNLKSVFDALGNKSKMSQNQSERKSFQKSQTKVDQQCNCNRLFCRFCCVK